jgi:hypothetical protein
VAASLLHLERSLFRLIQCLSLARLGFGALTTRLLQPLALVVPGCRLRWSTFHRRTPLWLICFICFICKVDAATSRTEAREHRICA